VLGGVLLQLACASTPPRLGYGEIPLPETDRVLEYAVYLPPGFAPAEALPLVVFLHGAGDGPDCFDEAGIGQRLDAAIAAGRVPRAVIVVPRGDLGFWENWVDGSYRYRDWVMRSLVPAIASRYGTRPCPAGCHLIGISMGGHGALRFALLEPGAFASVTAVSAPILNTEDALHLVNESWMRFVIPSRRIWGPGEREMIERDDFFLRWTRPEDLAGVHLMLAWGEADHARIVDTNERFEQHLVESGIPHESFVFPGRHDWEAWGPALEHVLATQLPAETPSAGTHDAHPPRAYRK
jgi:enterochelin esterase-like enzyme